MPTPVKYPDTTGFRADFSATVLRIDGQQFVGYKSIEMSRTRERAVVKGANADPLGKTRGSNSYKMTVEVYVAEFKAFLLDHFGAGYGDVMFAAEVDVTEGGYDTQTHRAEGCSVDSTDASWSQGTDPLTAKVDFGPVKIKFAGVDDNAVPLQGAPALA